MHSTDVNPLIYAMEKKDIITIKTLTAKNPKILNYLSTIKGKQMFPMHAAAACGFIEAMELFVEQYGIPIDQLDIQHGWNPLHRAGTREAIRWLLNKARQRGITLYKANKHGTTPLMRASSDGHLEAINTYLDMGYSIDEKDPNGKTPLIKAIEARDKGQAAALLLLQRGASITIKTKKDNLTPLQIAQKIGMKEIEQKILQMLQRPMPPMPLAAAAPSIPPMPPVVSAPMLPQRQPNNIGTSSMPQIAVQHAGQKRDRASFEEEVSVASSQMGNLGITDSAKRLKTEEPQPAASTQGQDDIDEFLLCQCCKKSKINASLGCGHTFCGECIQQHMLCVNGRDTVTCYHEDCPKRVTPQAKIRELDI